MVVTVGLSPALQRVYRFDGLVLGNVNRSTDVLETVGGKSMNAAAAAARFHHPVVALSVLGHNSEEKFIAFGKRAGVELRYVLSPVPTRQCCTLIDVPTASCTELVEESGAIPGHVADSFAKLAESVSLEVGSDSVVVFSGSVPSGVPASFVSFLVALFASRGIPVVLDVQGRILLDSIRAGKGVIKINENEFLGTFHLAGCSTDAVEARMEDLFASGYRTVVTRGSRPTLVYDGYSMREIPVRAIKSMNTTGCGDVFSGVLAALIAEKRPFLEAVCIAQEEATRKAEERDAFFCNAPEAIR